MRHGFSLVLFAILAAIGSGPARAAVYLTVAQAQAILCPGAVLTPVSVTLTDEQAAAIEADSGVGVRDRQIRAFKVSTGGWLILDEVQGEHAALPLAVAIDRRGAVSGVEILEDRDNDGDGVRDPAWRAQFVGKRRGAPLRLYGDIRPLAEALVSCRRIADGVRRLLSTHAIALSAG